MVVFLFFFCWSIFGFKLIGPAVWRVANFVPEKKPSVFLAYSNIQIERLCYWTMCHASHERQMCMMLCVVVIRTFFSFLKLVNSSSLCHATKSYLVLNNRETIINVVYTPMSNVSRWRYPNGRCANHHHQHMAFFSIHLFL